MNPLKACQFEHHRSYSPLDGKTNGAEATGSISIVVVNWNTKDRLRQCLSSVTTGHERQPQIIVVDNASSDGSAQMVREAFPRVTLIEAGANLGFAAANNMAIPHAAGEFVLFLNPDTSVKEGALARMAAFMRSHEQVGMVGPKMVHPDGRPYELGLQWFPTPFREFLRMLLLSKNNTGFVKRLFPYQDPNVSGFVSKLYGGCLMVRRRVLDDVGLFDARFFMYWEDVDLCRRISEHGFRLYYDPQAEVVHWSGSASRKKAANFAILTQCASCLKLMQKYYGRREAYEYRAAVFLAATARLLALTLMAVGPWLRHSRKLEYRESFRKYCAMVSWSIRPSWQCFPSRGTAEGVYWRKGNDI